MKGMDMAAQSPVTQAAPDKVPDKGAPTPPGGPSGGGPAGATAGAANLNSPEAKALLQQLIDVLTKLIALLQAKDGAAALTPPGGTVPPTGGGGTTPPTGTTPPASTTPPATTPQVTTTPAAPTAWTITTPNSGGRSYDVKTQAEVDQIKAQIPGAKIVGHT